MKMATNVYEYGRGGKCVCMFTYKYAGIRITNMQISKEDRNMGRVMRIKEHRAKICIEFAGKKKENRKVVMDTEPKTNHAALATQVERQVEKLRRSCRAPSG